MLEGSLKEIRFAWPDKESKEEGSEMKVIDDVDINLNEVSYMNGELLIGDRNYANFDIFTFYLNRLSWLASHRKRQ